MTNLRNRRVSSPTTKNNILNNKNVFSDLYRMHLVHIYNYVAPLLCYFDLSECSYTKRPKMDCRFINTNKKLERENLSIDLFWRKFLLDLH